MLNELINRKLKLFRLKSFFSNSFRYISNSFSLSFSRLSIFNSFQQSQSNVLTFRELLIIIASKCLKIINNKYVIYH